MEKFVYAPAGKESFPYTENSPYKMESFSCYKSEFFIKLMAAATSASVAAAGMSFFMVMVTFTVVAAFGIWVKI